MLLTVTPVAGGSRFAVRVQPRASRSEVVGVQDTALRVRLTAPPVEGQANAALIALLAERLGVRKSDVTIVTGQSGRNKWVEVAGLTPRDILARLGMGDD